MLPSGVVTQIPFRFEYATIGLQS